MRTTRTSAIRRMKKNLSFAFLLMVLAVGFATTSCSSGGDDEPTVTELTVSQSELVITSDGETVNFKVTSNSNWTISGNPAWLAVSPQSGNGTATVTLTPTENTSTQERSCSLTISTDDGKYAYVSVTQEANVAKNCKVTPNDIVILSDGFAFDCSYGDNVAYYYAYRFTENAVERMTEDEIVALAVKNGERNTPSDGYVISWKNQSPNTEYVVYLVGYNAQGKRGELVKTDIKTKSDKNQPVAEISNVRYTSSKWSWKTTPNGYTSKYYMTLFTNTDSYDYTDAAIAWFFKKAMDETPDNYTPIIKEDTWSADRNGSKYIHIVTWAVNADNEFSGVIDRYRGYVSSSSTAQSYVKDSSSSTRSSKNFSITPKVNYLTGKANRVIVSSVAR